MTTKFEIIFKNADANVANGQERVLNKCKELYWNEAPADWKNFDGDLYVQYRESKGVHDCAVIIFYSSFWQETILKAFEDDKDVYSITQIA